LAAITVGTGLIDQAEHIQDGQSITTFGPLFPLFIAHLVSYIAAALHFIYFRNRHSPVRVRGQLAVIGFGMFVMAAIGLVTNVLLPYGFQVFSFQDAGAFATVILLVAIAYAITVTHLFDVRIVIKRTLVYSLLLTAIAGGYSGVEYIFTELLQQLVGSGSNPIEINIIGTIIVSLFVSPVRHWLERKIDKLLFPHRHKRRLEHRSSPIRQL
jgi:hypothetical protein